MLHAMSYIFIMRIIICYMPILMYMYIEILARYFFMLCQIQNMLPDNRGGVC